MGFLSMVVLVTFLLLVTVSSFSIRGVQSYRQLRLTTMVLRAFVVAIDRVRQVTSSSGATRPRGYIRAYKHLVLTSRRPPLLTFYSQ